MRGYVRAQTVLRTNLSNPSEAHSEEEKVSLLFQEMWPKECEASGLQKRVKGLLDQGQGKSERGSGTPYICLTGTLFFR